MNEIYTVILNCGDNSVLKHTVTGRLVIERGTLIFATIREGGKHMTTRAFAPGTWKEVYLSDREGNEIDN